MSTFTIDSGTSRATPSPVPGKRMTVPAIRARKVRTGRPPSRSSCSPPTRCGWRNCSTRIARCCSSATASGQVIYGLPSTVPVTMEMMCAHGAAVVRGSWHSLVAVDMPFGSYEASPEQAFASAARIMKESGCAAVKLEGGEAMAPTIAFLSQRGIPVIGHVGLTPQAVNQLGGYGARGKSDAEAAKIVGDARAVADAGAFCIVVEGVMEAIADESPRRSPCRSSASAPRPAATAKCWSPRTCSACSSAPRASSNAMTTSPARITAAVETYAGEVRARSFPTADQTYRPKA